MVAPFPPVCLQIMRKNIESPRLTGPLLALDLGTKMGWAYGDGRSATDYGMVNFGNKRGFRSEGRFARFRDWLLDQYSHRGKFQVVYESIVAHGDGTRTGQVYGGWLAVLELFQNDFMTPVSAFGVSTIRKGFVGHGRADKDRIEAAVRSLGYQPQDQNVSDALAVFCFARGEIGNVDQSEESKPGGRRTRPGVARKKVGTRLLEVR